MTACVVSTADDFGRSASINAAVARAHREGVLTSASLMVGGEAAGEAIEMARALPDLAVGLHLVVAGGRSVLPAAELPHVVDRLGQLPASPAGAWLRYLLRPAARVEIAREIAAQFERFAASGLPLSHVDGHLHLHLHPAVLPEVLRQAQDHGARGIRLPRDDLRLSLKHDTSKVAEKALWAVVFGALGRRARGRIEAAGLAVADHVYGLMQSGHMAEGYVLDVLRGLSGTAELYFHPDEQAQSERLGPNPADLATLLSPAVRRVIVDRGLQLATYADL